MMKNKKLETAMLFKHRKIEFTKKEILHTIDLYNEMLGKKVPVKIVSEQSSVNGEIMIFLNPKFPYSPLDFIHFQVYEMNRINSIYISGEERMGPDALSFRNYIFLNGEKVKENERRTVLIHELQHTFDYYHNLIPSVPHLPKEFDAVNCEYRAILAEFIFDDIEKINEKNIYLKKLLPEMEENISSFGYNQELFPHLVASVKILRSIKDINKPEDIIEKCKFLLNNEYIRLTGKSYDEMLDDLVNV